MGFKNYLNVYEFECELPGSGEIIKYKPVVTTQIKKLLVYENETNPIVIEEAFDELITSCIITKDFNIDDLYLQDRHFLLIELRKVSKGEVYEFEFKCPKCKSDNMSGISFKEFKITKKLKDIDHKIKITDNVAIYIDHITRGQQKEAYKNINKKLSPNLLQAEMAFNSIAKGITSIETPDGIETDLSFENQLDIMNNLSFNIFDVINTWYKTNDFGIDLTYKYNCIHCDYISNKETMEITSNFF